MRKFKKPLRDLNLLDRFLFAQVMEDPEAVQTMLELLLGEEILLKGQPQTEKEQRTLPQNRYVKLDVWAEDTDGVVYDAEPQKENTNNLPKRSRYYQALIDCNLLPPGTINFNQLKDSYIIIIAPFDPFGKGLYQYTFKNQCEEVPGLPLGDGATRIFFNCHGKNADEMRPELVELLTFMEHTTKLEGQQSKSPKIQKLKKRVEVVKSSEQIGVKYMQEWEERVMEQQEAREEGLEEGKAIGHAEGEAKGLAKGRAEGKAIGHAEGEAKGLAKGRAEGETKGRTEERGRLNLLNSKLIKAGRMDDLVRATEDEVFLEELFREFEIS